ncbi:DUF2399 domain-containing protein [Streptomyces sp. NPDC001941]|uniref:DUF2399 domain-containing protein n=1 Tax=Streptomyces sp. NPDC001941 TaxID=3154659 RepID=UPI00331E0DB8
MDSGKISVTAPHASAERAAVLGLLGPRPLLAGQTRRIDLNQLTRALEHRGPHLTPGAVAAHALGTPLAQKAAEDARSAARLESLRRLRSRLSRALPPGVPLKPREDGWEQLYRRGSIARLLHDQDPEFLLRAVYNVLGRLPTSARVDRRRLAHDATGNPHALDAGSEIASLVLAEAACAFPRHASSTGRGAWEQLGVELDSLAGGLLAVGLHPRGWHVPPGQPCALVPWVLNRAAWPSPADSEDRWVFVTENPSVTTAALVSPPGTMRLLCTVGTPSSVTLQALARIATAGWRVAVRADFDAAGLAVVRAVLSAVPDARVWRMAAASYTASLHPAPFRPDALDFDKLGDTPWDPTLVPAMQRAGRPAYEEALIDDLLADLKRRSPPADTTPAGKPPGDGL